MKRSLFLLFVLLASSAIFARTQPGKSSFAARLTNFGNEFGFGRMISPTAMVLIDANMQYQSTSESAEVGTTVSEGDVHSSFSLTGYPEYRFYILPRNRVVPYFGLFGLLGIGSTSSEEPTGTSTTARNGSTLALGGGVTMGAEFFLNEFISLATHARVLQYSFTSEKVETDSGFSVISNIVKTHRLGMQFEPSLYVRIYF